MEVCTIILGYKEFSLGVLFTYKYSFDVINGNKHECIVMVMQILIKWEK